MELATNNFNKGLQLDTHPTVTGNDVMTDCLNGTLITMSGNEVILLNDMGNRRVDNAYLPSGYEPVGIKEYGGIIYIAAYNPITNKSLIGSFPSPERKIGSLDDENLGCEFNLFNHFYKQNTNNIRFIDSDVILLPLTSNTSLHAGDKFTIYSDLIEYWKPYLSNYNNITSKLGKKVISPKNKHITLSIGILNSQNQFVDITKTLKRWDNSSIPSSEKKYDNTFSDLYKFNDGYFICNSKISNNELDYSINDKLLIKERLISPANTYAYKLVGPLYLRALLNHIQEFSFNITGDKTILSKNNILNLIITADILYNCPDGSSGQGNYFNENYQYDGCGEIQGYWDVYNISESSSSKFKLAFDFYKLDKNGLYINLINNITSINYTKPIYNNGMYKTTVIMKWKDEDYLDDLQGENAKFKYYICVDSGIPLNKTSDNNPYYISSLSTKGEIDLNKLASGEISLKSFRFFNNVNDKTTTITYSLEAYPKLNQVFKRIYFYLYDVENSSDRIIIEKNSNGIFPANNGRNIISFNWDVNNIKFGKLYKVTILVEDSTYGLVSINDGERWFLTTELFNDCYNSLSSNFVEDFGRKVYDKTDENYGNLSSKLKEYNNKLLEKLFVDFNIVKEEENKKCDEVPVYTKSGKLIVKSTEVLNYITYTVLNTYTIKRQINDHLEIINNNLYPLSLYLDYSKSKLRLTNKSNFILNSNINIVNNNEIESLDPNTNFDNLYFYFSNGEQAQPLIVYNKRIYNGDEFEIKIQCFSKLFSEPSYSKNIRNGFGKIRSEDFRKVLNETTSYTGFFVTNKDIVGGDGHYIGIVYNHDYISVPIKGESEANKYMGDGNMFSEHEDTPKHLNFDNETIKGIYKEMNDKINTNPNKNYTFAYIFSAINVIGYPEEDIDWKNYLAYIGDLNAPRTAGVRIKTGDNPTQEEINLVELLNDLNTSGFCPITCCKVWWKNALGENWVLLNNDRGVFGGTNEYYYMLPENVYSQYTYVGCDLFDYSNDEPNTHKLYNARSSASTLYNDVFFEGTRIFDSVIPHGINKKVLDLIMEFLDPNDKIVYNIYRQTSLRNANLVTISDNCKYTLDYSGELTGFIEYEDYENILKVNSEIYEILPFKDGIIRNKDLGHLINIPFLSYKFFELDIRDILDNDEILNIYIENGSSRDADGNLLSENTIYKIKNDGLFPVEGNVPYKVEKVNDNLNSLVSIISSNSPSSLPSRYLRASSAADDNDSLTTLEFSGENLMTVDSNIFKGL